MNLEDKEEFDDNKTFETSSVEEVVNSNSFDSTSSFNENVSQRYQNKKRSKRINLGKILSFGLTKNTDEYNQRVYVQSKMDRVRLHAASVFFAGMYDEKRVTMRYLVTTISAVIYSVITFFFVDITGLYSSGTSGLFQGFARLIGTALSLHGVNQDISNDVYQGLFWGIWFLANIPLILFAWYKVGKRFTKLTLVFVVTATFCGLLLSIPIFINPTNKFNYFFLGNPLTMDDNLNKYDVYVLSWNYFPRGSLIHFLPLSNELNGKVDSLEAFNNMDSQQWDVIDALRTKEGYMDLPRVLSLLGYTALLTLFYPLTISVNYIIGGCTGGMDIPSIYWSDKARKQLGNTLMILNTITMFIGIILGSYVSAGISTPNHWGAEYFFSPNLVLSIIYSIIGYLSVNFYFPKYKQSVIKIYSTKPQLIVNRMNELKYPYQLNVYESIQLINGKEFKTHIIETVARYIEVPKIIHEIKNVDDEGLLTINMLHGIDGYLFMNKERD